MRNITIDNIMVEVPETLPFIFSRVEEELGTTTFYFSPRIQMPFPKPEDECLSLVTMDIETLKIIFEEDFSLQSFILNNFEILRSISDLEVIGYKETTWKEKEAYVYDCYASKSNKDIELMINPNLRIRTLATKHENNLVFLKRMYQEISSLDEEYQEMINNIKFEGYVGIDVE